MHSYLLPYFINYKDGVVKVLLGKKKLFNKKDGYIHNNPGQIVIIGGGSFRKTLIGKKLDALKEFKEETGHQLNIENITNVYEGRKYSISYYRVKNKKEYNKLCKLKSKEYYKEIDKIFWVPIKKAKFIFSDIKHNKPCGGNIHKCIKEYISYSDKWNICKMNEYKGLDLYLRHFTSFKIHSLVPLLKKKINKKNKLYKYVKNHLYNYINQRSYIDWFEKGIEKLENI